MNMNDYQKQTVDLAFYPGQGTPLGLIYCALKVNGEAGEFAEHVGKAIRDDGFNQTHQDAPLTPERLQLIKKELGDILWYVAAASRELGFSLAEIAETNIKKLNERKIRGTLSGEGDNR